MQFCYRSWEELVYEDDSYGQFAAHGQLAFCALNSQVLIDFARADEQTSRVFDVIVFPDQNVAPRF